MLQIHCLHILDLVLMVLRRINVMTRAGVLYHSVETESKIMFMITLNESSRHQNPFYNYFTTDAYQYTLDISTEVDWGRYSFYSGTQDYRFGYHVILYLRRHITSMLRACELPEKAMSNNSKSFKQIGFTHFYAILGKLSCHVSN